jgi:xyloglucan-specific exo-beta-1,4-glucanase
MKKNFLTKTFLLSLLIIGFVGCGERTQLKSDVFIDDNISEILEAEESFTSDDTNTAIEDKEQIVSVPDTNHSSNATSSNSTTDTSSNDTTDDTSSSDTGDSSESVAISATAYTTAQNLTVGTAMSSFSPLTPSGGAAPYTFSITSGTLPTGLNLDLSTGEVRGTPIATYTAANVVFSVQDANYVVASTTSTVSFSVDLAASVPPSTGWTTVKMGGGGYTPGIIYHPTVNKLRYARTDMDGVYRWDNNISEWTPLTDAFPPEDANHQGAESMAVDPTDANKVYMTTSMSVSYGNGRFYYSSNQGSTWNYVDLPFEIGSNNQGRGIGERLMVDPNFPSTLFYASRTQGLWKSTNYGLQWSQVTTLSDYKMSASDITNSNGGSPIGIEFVMFDTTVPTTSFTPTGSATQTIYVGVAPDYKALAGLSSYLYKSTDGGVSWTGVTIPTEVTNTTTGDPATPVHPYIPHMARSADGVFYVPFGSSSGPGSSAPSWLYKFDGDTTWELLTKSGDGNYYGGIGGLCVYGTGATTKIALGVSGTWGDGAWVQIVMASDDAGSTWHEIGRSGDLDGTTDYHDATGTTAVANPGYSGWVDDLDIDPFDPNHVTYVTGGGPWSTNNAFSASDWKPHWKFDVNGIEEMVNLGMMVPPPEASYVLASAHGDTGLYVHTSLIDAPTRSPNIGDSPPLGVFGNGTGIDMAWENPAYIVAVGTFGETSDGAYSTDSGVTWTKFQAVPPSASNSGDHSKVAVTADGSNIIWSVQGQVPYYSTDSGNTWVETNLPAPAAAYGASYHIVADRKNPLKVYAYDHGGEWWIYPAAGKFYYSTDGGHTFTASAQTWDSYGFNNTDLAINPFVEGDLWLADANNLWHSIDSGVTWTKLTGTLVSTSNTIQHGAMKVALGVPAVGSSYSAAVYFVGRLLTDGVYVYGVYRSDDEGASWTRIDDDDHRYGGVGGIAADTHVYGRVFLAGRGMNYNY